MQLVSILPVLLITNYIVMFLGVCSSFKDAFVFLSINERTLNYTMIVTFLHFQIFLSYRTSLASENSHTPCLHQWFIYLVFIVFVFITIFRIKGKYSNEIRIKLFFFAFMLLSVSSCCWNVMFLMFFFIMSWKERLVRWNLSERFYILILVCWHPFLYL